MIAKVIVLCLVFGCSFVAARWASDREVDEKGAEHAASPSPSTLSAITPRPSNTVGGEGRSKALPYQRFYNPHGAKIVGSGRASMEAAGKWFRDDWRAASAWAANLPEQERRQTEWWFVNGALMKPAEMAEAPDGWREWIGDWLSDERNRGRRASLSYSGVGGAAGNYVKLLAKTDPAGSLVWAEKNLSGKVLGNAIGEIVREGYGNSAAAMELVESLPPGGLRTQAAGALAHEMVESDVLDAFRFAAAEEIVADGVRGDWWAYFGKAVSRKDLEATKQILAEEKHGDQRSFRSHAMWALVKADPQGTLEWASAVEGERGRGLVEAGLNSWRRQDAKAAAAWEAGRPDR